MILESLNLMMNDFQMHGILDGISSLHSWMKNQASTAAGGRRGEQRQERRGPRERVQTYDEVCFKEKFCCFNFLMFEHFEPKQFFLNNLRT